ncbi:MAG: DUF488 domain-containing protein [Microcoleus sp. PH2017_10_PVI_O_A]|uniref:DUF488 domain-containing protein n=1 Tax=unclassified Microcoleus TaxID=2642155 RepID=UPI001D21A574|nr:MULTISPECIES: DUF488 domain-containing protein [unclassified Microcoleus]TAE83880.1 MAG: DUF488 domain-containing protein [Oscillatoriales cyanobacterium]MCC3405750.1 DUF488 domain-containing protein [Microcoleus sp. PH2017_10_PVI_O_A]MCC3459736.1 DUF488 domain-containing protein [Microcoleus sp. PH2017_11_PCY_U_A]MCC3477758.1 DUF488 domain-containing protein [Microcoleus sp. PH2017_12_PCY_D_A]MCC3529852.1 DUF488 domain-containing protein [Microcoleus sp. PH2017_21_RUC_O_A]
MELFTIGHSNHSIEAFLLLLQQHRITAVADVRSHPFSRYLPHFNKSEITASLSAVGIQYVFLGQELGARPEDLSCYDTSGKALYDRIAATPLFAAGIQRLLKGAAHYKISLMCAEKDPLTCHRTILVCHKLKEFNLQINHILSDGSLESHQDLEARLLSKFNKGKNNNEPIQLSLFEIEPQVKHEIVDLETAYYCHGLEVAYVSKERN